MRRRRVLEYLAAMAGATSIPRALAATGADADREVLTPSRQRLQKALKRGFGIQYWGDTFTTFDLSNAPHGVLIVEATREIQASDHAREVLFHREEVETIQNGGTRLALGYLNLTEIEGYRDYWNDRNKMLAAPGDLLAASWIGPLTGAGERLARFWDPEWIAILEARLDRLMELGLDGVFFDDVLHYYTYASGLGLTWPVGKLRHPVESRGYATAMLELVCRLCARARRDRPDTIVVVNNGVYLESDAGNDIGASDAADMFGQYAEGIDGIVVESAFGPKASPAIREVLTKQYLDRGISVMAVDFATQFPGRPPERVYEDVARRASRHGYSSYVAGDDLFNQLYPPTLG